MHLLAGLAAAAAKNVRVKKRKNSTVKLKASDYVGLPKKKEKRNTAVKLKASD